MQPNARQVLLPGDRSLIEGCLACELQLKVLWYGVNGVSWLKVPFQLPDLQFYAARRCHILTEFCLIPLWDWTVATWSLNSRWRYGWQVVYKGCFPPGICSGQFPRHFQFLKSSQAMAGGEKDKTDNWHQATSPLQHLWHLTSTRWTRVISCA